MSTSKPASLSYSSPLGMRMNALAQGMRSRRVSFAIAGLAVTTQTLWPHAGLPVSLIVVGGVGGPIFSYLAWRIEMDEGRVALARARGVGLLVVCTLVALAGAAILKLG